MNEILVHHCPFTLEKIKPQTLGFHRNWSSSLRDSQELALKDEGVPEIGPQGWGIPKIGSQGWGVHSKPGLKNEG